jgi:hypothetical protein
MTFRRTLFTLYGMGIGLAYIAAVLAIAWPPSLILTALLGVVVVAMFGYYGNRLPKAAEMSDWQILVAMPLLPFAMFGAMIGFAFILLVIVVVWPYAAIRWTVAERRFRVAMKSKSRFVFLDDLRPRLIAGEGTLIEDTGLNGPYRLWWTEDDLFAFGSPASTREEFISIYEGKGHPFNSRCVSDYLDEDTGKALLTSIPARYAAPGKLARKFPRVRVAKVYRSFVRPQKEHADGE